MKQQNKILVAVLSILIGLFFIFSAWSKTTPNLQYFETIIHQQLGLSDLIAALSARFFIGLEAALGIMLVINVFGSKKWVLKACILLLIVFSIHLLILWISQGSEVDCGCMGSIVSMNPWVSLIKNMVLLLLVGILHKKSEEEHNIYNQVLCLIVTLVIIAAPFVLYPMGPRNLPLSLLYASEIQDQPAQELRKGQHILCFMTLTCPHCRHAATLINEINEEHPGLPFYILFPKVEDDSLQAMQLADFEAETKIHNLPYSFIPREQFGEMIKAAGEDGVPTMLWMTDTTINRKMEIPDLEQRESILKEMEHWYHPNHP